MVTTTPVTIEQAAAILGVSASTIRRRIRAGILQVEEARRPQGVVWLVHLPPGTASAATAATIDTAPVDTAATAQPAPAEAIAAMIQATLTPIIAPLVGQIDAQRQTVERLTDQLMSQAEAIAELREDRSRQSGELEALRAENQALRAAQTSPEPSTPLWRSWGYWWPILAVLVAVIVAGVLAWLR
jgi:hypothetical protein